MRTARLTSDELTAGGLRVWITGHDPVTGEDRGPKSYSIAALLHPELAPESEALQGRLRDRTLLTWQTELTARGAWRAHPRRGHPHRGG